MSREPSAEVELDTRVKPESASRQWVTKGAVLREDSDDELGAEDHPWEWVFEEEGQDFEANGSTKRKLGKASKILGARTQTTNGFFECRLGDTILLKSPEAGKDWVGIVSEFIEEEDEDGDIDMLVNIMWMASPDEFATDRNRNKRRADCMPNEQYLTTNFDPNPINSINGKAIVLSKEDFLAKFPDGVAPKGGPEKAMFDKCVVCRRAVDQRRGVYTEEFKWDEMQKDIQEDLLDVVARIKSELKKSRKRKADDTDYDQKKDVDSVAAPATPRKRQKTTAKSTPKTQRQTKSYMTPTHKRIVVKKPLEFTPLGTRILPPAHFAASPYKQARSLLHVSSVPMALPCRDVEFETVYTHLSAAIQDGTGACIYISGTPGTGKTATVREVVAQLNASVGQDETEDFVFVEINGMKVTDPHQSYSLLWEALKGDRVSPSHALDLLEREFSHPSPRRIPCVVLMDELDQLVTKNQSVMYNFFNWPSLRHSRLIVLAVANTMDLPERTLSNKISSRLGLTRITFPGYTHNQLMEIISKRLEAVPGNIVDADAIQFASRKVAAVSGDARRALDICRRAVEIAEQVAEDAQLKQQQDVEITPATPSKTPGRNDKAQEQASQPTKPLPRVTIGTIKRAITEATSTPLHHALRALPLASKLFLSALIARVRRTGIPESTLGEILDEARTLALMDTSAKDSAVRKWLIEGDANKKGRVKGMGFAAMELVGAGVVGVEGAGSGGYGRGGRTERCGKVRLRVGVEDVTSALRGDEEGSGIGF